MGFIALTGKHKAIVLLHLLKAMATPPLVTFRGHRASVNALLCEDDKRPNEFASGSDDGSCRLWDVRTARATRSMNIRKALGLTAPGDDASESAVNSLAFSAAGDCLHVAASNKVLTFDLRQETLVFDCASKEVLQANDDEINALARHPSKQGKYLSAPDDNGDIRIYDMEMHRLYKTLSGQHMNICSAAPFRPNAPWDLVSGGLDGFLLFWDFSRGRMKFKLDLNTGVNSLDAADASASGGVSRLFNPPLVHAVAFAPNGKSLAAGLGDASIAVVDFASKHIVRRLKHHSAAVSQVHFPAFRSHDWLFSCGNDAKVCIWDYARALEPSTHDDVDTSDSATVPPSPELVKAFDVARGPNAITTSLHQHLVLVADVSNTIAAYPVL